MAWHAGPKSSTDFCSSRVDGGWSAWAENGKMVVFVGSWKVVRTGAVFIYEYFVGIRVYLGKA